MVCRLPYQSRTELRKHTHSLIRRYNSGGGQTELLDAWSWLTRAKIWRSKISDSYRESWKTAKTRQNFCAMMPFPAECRKRGKCIYINDLAWREEKKKTHIFEAKSSASSYWITHMCMCMDTLCVWVCCSVCKWFLCIRWEKKYNTPPTQFLISSYHLGHPVVMIDGYLGKMTSMSS